MQTEARIRRMLDYMKARKKVKINDKTADSHDDVIKRIDDSAITCIVDILEWVLSDGDQALYDIEDFE